ncbi:hypothetical protein [Paraburkholderia sp. BL25I1N1]|uniref:hypothetical protein n=1 Tax=Paraburkholderia sp. BL25I1N1 TaxID=1938804 RepID=UPI000D04DF41|nr:hypothetical protein [Paraburkholderia sp. BL25I1N1]PRX98422.1 hypothetical protein B0G73_125119 [Paraburkholderia sp. BL25I1N1]
MNSYRGPSQSSSAPQAEHHDLQSRRCWCHAYIENWLREIDVAIVLAGERQYRKVRAFSYWMTRRSFDGRSKRLVGSRKKLNGGIAKRTYGPNAIALPVCLV